MLDDPSLFMGTSNFYLVMSTRDDADDKSACPCDQGEFQHGALHGDCPL